MKRALLAGLAAWAGVAWAGNENVHVTYHWHLHQPIYWPEKHPGLNRYQYGRDSVDLKLSGTGNWYAGSTYKHPRNQLVQGDGGEYDAVFDKDDRKQAYQSGGMSSIQTLLGYPDAGASVSYSGALQENIASFGRVGAYGYGPGWNSGYTTARGWTTSGGFPRADMLGMTFHHAFSPLLPDSVLRKEIRIFKEIWWKSWGGNADKSDHSRGFWPVECAFSRHMIPVLLDEGYQWSIVANSHLARTCNNYMDVVQRGTSGWNIDPPNAADRLGPTVPAGQWYNGQIDGRGGTFPAPYAYQAHRAQSIDPWTGEARTLVIVPMCDLQSYINGFQTMGAGQFQDEIAPYATDPNRPCIVLLAHDGDNAWGGGSSYYFESVPGLMADAAGRGMQPTTIQQFLSDHPVPESAVVHIEDGAWVNAANDWGHPQFVNWLWPPARAPSDEAYSYADPRTWVDIENGWAEDWRNWAVLMAGANFCETAEQVAVGNGRDVQNWRIQEPYQADGAYNWPNNAEQAWHYYLGGLDSGFMYYGTSLDDEVKQTLACNRAIGLAQAALADNPGSVPDGTPPTVFKPQRWPWNPGGMGWGPTTGYRPVGFDGTAPHYSDFYVWTLVFDVSGVESVTLYVRPDQDGVNPVASVQNETFAGGPEVGAWTAIPMTKRVIDKAFNGNNSQVDFFMLPTHIADHYWARVTGYSETLLDYYVEAVDAGGNGRRSVIQHVYVGARNSEGPSVTFSTDVRDCASATVTYDAGSGPLGGAAQVFMDYTFDAWGGTNTVAMTAQGGSLWEAGVSPPDDAPALVVRFHDGAGTVDDHDGQDWSTPVRDCEDPQGPATVSVDPPAPEGCGSVDVTYYPNDGPLRYAAQVWLHVGHDGWRDAADLPMTAGGPNTWTRRYAVPAGTRVIQCAFHDGASTWDDNGGGDWLVNVTNCEPVGLILTRHSPVVNDDPAEQNDPGDAFDFDRSGGSAVTLDQGGFGSFGRVQVNGDDSRFYIGAEGCDLSGNNNGMILFLGVDTLGDDAGNLWGLSGLPNGLDALHNLLLSPPMDIAIVVGDEWGDGPAYTNFNLGNDYNFGQGIYYLSAAQQTFVPVPGSRLSQFDGSGTNATGSADYDGDRLMNRWEASIPWASLGLDGMGSFSNAWLAGVIASSTTAGNDRYLSGNVLGSGASGARSGVNYGTNVLSLSALPILPPGHDGDADGLRDAWELGYAVNLGFLAATNDWDGDGATEGYEQDSGTDPTDGESVFTVRGVGAADGTNVVVRWHSVAGRVYHLSRALSLADGFEPVASNLAATAPLNVYTDSVSAATGVFYRVATPVP